MNENFFELLLSQLSRHKGPGWSMPTKLEASKQANANNLVVVTHTEQGDFFSSQYSHEFDCEIFCVSLSYLCEVDSGIIHPKQNTSLYVFWLQGC